MHNGLNLIQRQKKKKNPDIQPSHGNVIHVILSVPLILLIRFVDFFSRSHQQIQICEIAIHLSIPVYSTNLSSIIPFSESKACSSIKKTYYFGGTRVPWAWIRFAIFYGNLIYFQAFFVCITSYTDNCKLVICNVWLRNFRICCPVRSLKPMELQDLHQSSLRQN